MKIGHRMKNLLHSEFLGKQLKCCAGVPHGSTRGSHVDYMYDDMVESLRKVRWQADWVVTWTNYTLPLGSLNLSKNGLNSKIDGRWFEHKTWVAQN